MGQEEKSLPAALLGPGRLKTGGSQEGTPKDPEAANEEEGSETNSYKQG